MPVSLPVPVALRICALIPITRPRASNSGPPEFPCVIGASVWMASPTLKDEVTELIEPRIGAGNPEAAPDGGRVLVAERAPHRRNGITGTHPRRVAERHGHERMRRRI